MEEVAPEYIDDSFDGRTELTVLGLTELGTIILQELQSSLRILLSNWHPLAEGFPAQMAIPSTSSLNYSVEVGDSFLSSVL